MPKKDLSSRLAAVERQLAEVRVRAIESSEFRLVDKSGKVRAVLEMSRLGPRLVMMHADGTAGLEVSLPPDGPAVTLSDEDGETRVFLGATRDAARVALADSKGNQRMFLGVSAAGKPSLTVYDAKQKAVWSATP
jgi:hypothetical protein